MFSSKFHADLDALATGLTPTQIQQLEQLIITLIPIILALFGGGPTPAPAPVPVPPTPAS